MKSYLLLSFALVSIAAAQSTAASKHASTAAQHSGTAVVESVQAVGATIEAPVRFASGVAAIPLWASGSVVKGSGRALTESGQGTKEVAEKLWDFAEGDTPPRPKLNREAAVPSPLPKRQAPPSHDPSPAAVLNPTR